MMTPQPAGARAPIALRVAGLLAVLAGIMGMQGLADQCVDGMVSMSHAVLATASPVLDASSPELLPTTSGDMPGLNVDDAFGAGGVVTAVVPEGMNTPMAGFRIALLVVGLGALTMLLRGRRVAPITWMLPQAVGGIARIGRDPSTPSPARLSIRRC